MKLAAAVYPRRTIARTKSQGKRNQKVVSDEARQASRPATVAIQVNRAADHPVAAIPHRLMVSFSLISFLSSFFF